MALELALERLLRVAVGAGCAYEIMAIASHGKVPTISSLSWRALDTGRGRLLVLWLLGLLVWHILGVGPLARPRSSGQ